MTDFNTLYGAQLDIVLTRVFGDIDPENLAWLHDEVEWMSLETGEYLFYQGDSGTDMCVVVTGRLRVTYRDNLGVERIVGDVVSGETVGEFALLTDELRSATVYAVRETHAVRITREVFFRLFERQPNTMLHFTQTLVRRQQRVQSGKAQRARVCLNVAVIPIHGPLTSSFLSGLSEAIGQYGKTLQLDAESFDRAYGTPNAHDIDTDDPGGAGVAGWLSNLENEYDTLLYVGQPGWTTWTRRCVRQADRVYLVADARQPANVTRVEQAIRQQHPNLALELVLLHPANTAHPTGTADWLSRRVVRAHHHIRSGAGQHLRRLARRMLGRSIGLVLSGGGARGLAHIGVIKALEEVGIELDLLCGTSIGALVAAGYVLYPTADALAEATAKFANPRHIFDYTVPLVSLMTSRKISQVYKDVFGDTMIEDFWTPFFALSSNMSRAEPMIHRSGLARRAIRATTAIPGVFTPLLMDGEVLVDGGLLDNFPTTPAREFLGGGRLIGVLASPLNDNVPFYSVTDEYLSGWRVLLNRLNPFGKQMQLPSMPGLVVRSIELFNVLRIKTSLQGHDDDLIIQIEPGSIGGLDFSNYRQLVDIGYRQALPHIKAWHTNGG